MQEYIYEPDIDYFKSIFKMFNYDDIDTEFLKDQLKNYTIQFRRMILNMNYTEPTEENGLPFISIKNYICYEAARLLTVNFVSNSDLINFIRTESLRLKEIAIKDLSSIVVGENSYDSVRLDGDIKKP
ncbi:hypothetical protein OFR22_03110 [Brachyspira hyodysenteriae]|uniref:OrfB n=3 Tax=Brachyspira hyodysenteriae TaxID=159 RepID=B9USA1_BRAHW|nr:hypothetical protein [Brachyspira hyodysenteriae]AAX81969.1 OrfB [Brachyspira hyodysenteriae]ACH69311.1 putative VSH-1 protein [Brachyspira hyodysenteriae WA1]ACN84306.1 OrfB [Serpulina phage VSH-1] [Brachyspira hyodysenteriae WA1]ANN63606.1 hypothetical protein BHYOB78_06910 [Brachyspira hyodysenteriae ATCC 27164]AUJ50032.1 hypothetical protein BH718_01596 [Brachyspira hyodysenteriae]